MSGRAATIPASSVPRQNDSGSLRNLAGVDSPTEYAALARGLNCTMDRWMGAQVGRLDGVPGTRFSVWAPNAQEVCVICNRNEWRHGGFYLNSSDTGVWAGFFPDMAAGETYKYSLRAQNGELIEKSRPLRLCGGASAPVRVDCLRSEPVYLERLRMDGPPAQPELARAAGCDL